MITKNPRSNRKFFKLNLSIQSMQSKKGPTKNSSVTDSPFKMKLFIAFRFSFFCTGNFLLSHLLKTKLLVAFPLSKFFLSFFLSLSTLILGTSKHGKDTFSLLSCVLADFFIPILVGSIKFNCTERVLSHIFYSLKGQSHEIFLLWFFFLNLFILVLLEMP